MEHRFHVAGDGVDLGHVADAEGSQEAEHGEQRRQHLADGFAALLRPQAVPEVVHGAAAPFTLLIFPAVVDAQHVFGIVGHHAKEGNEPHPEHSAGAAHQNGAGHTHDVAGTHSSGQSGAQALELGDGAVLRVAGHFAVAEDGADGLLHPVAEVAHLEELGQACGQHAYKGQQDQGRPAPDDVVQDAVYLRNGV